MLKTLPLIFASSLVFLTPTLAQQATPASPAAAQAGAPASGPSTAKPKKPPTEKQIAARNRMKACGAEWREKKATMTGTTWRQFSKECLSRKI